MTPIAPISRSTLTFHVCRRPCRKLGLVVVGARPDAAAVARALSRRTLPVTLSGVASGGLAVERIDEEVVRSIAERDVERIAQAGLERRDARIAEGPWIEVEAGVLRAADFAAELDDVTPVQVGRGVARGEGRDRAAAREPGG